jgi:hypothetical protein
MDWNCEVDVMAKIILSILVVITLLGFAACGHHDSLPQLTNLLAQPASVARGEVSSLTCEASDPDGDTLTYSWTSTEGSISGTGSTVSWTAPATVGTYTVTVSVSDGKGGTATQSVSITVTNRNPAISNLTANPATVNSGGSTTIGCTASDPDSDTLTYSWTYTGGSISGTGSTVTWTAPSAFGIYIVTAIVNDGKGGTATQSVFITVTNHNPAISSLTATPASVVTGANSTIRCTASDPDGDALTYSWTITGGSISGTGSTVTWTAPSTAGTFYITVIVSDGKGGTATRSVSITATNRNPAISSLIATPATVVTGGNSVITCTASDPDSDTLTYSWIYVGGSISGSGNTITWTAPSAFGIYIVTAIVSDGKGGIATQSVSITVTNHNPAISSLTTTPTSVVTGANSIIRCTASDPDGDALTYSWTITGGSISGTGSTVTWTAPSTAGTFYITVIVSDGKGGTATRSVSITVTTP